MESFLKIEIPKYAKKANGGSDVVYFEFIVTRGTETWKLEKRYSECSDFYNALKKSHGDFLPDFPSKSFFSLKSYEQLNPRRQRLESFFQSLGRRLDLVRDRNTISFLKVDASGQNDFGGVVKIVGKMSCSFGVRDFIYDIGKKGNTQGLYLICIICVA